MKISNENKLGISRNVLAMGLVSFLNDVASEMLNPIVPIFLVIILGAPASVASLVEKIAEFTASILKVISGWYSDKFQKRKPFAAAGYSLSRVGEFGKHEMFTLRFRLCGITNSLY
jgi:hypothetical protein